MTIKEGADLRALSCAVALSAVWFAGVAVAQMQPSPPTAPFEIVKSRTDIDVSADGSYVEATELALRVLDSRGQKALQQTTLAAATAARCPHLPTHSTSLAMNAED